MVRLLLQHGAPPNLADFKGNRPLHYATTENVARWLVAYGARLKMTNHAKQSGEDQWGSKLDKYVMGTTLQAGDCQVLEAVAENNMWFDDKLSNGCLLCGNTFTVWMRRHHCRSCGLLVCQPCSLRKLNFTKVHCRYSPLSSNGIYLVLGLTKYDQFFGKCKISKHFNLFCGL